METLETLAVALGFASLAGVNLYLTVFVTGLAVNMQWVHLPEKYGELAVLGEPAVIIAAGIFAAIEFFSDKIPWVDSAWDSVHTVIRPIGGGLLALTALGPADPAFAVIVGMLAGGTSLMTHGLKSGTRIAINSSPEPVSNMAVSLTEDMAVIGGLAMMSVSPLVFAGVALAFLVLAIFMAPKLFRRGKSFSWLLWKRFSSGWFRPDSLEAFSGPLGAKDQAKLERACQDTVPNPEVKWSIPAVVGGSKKVGKLAPHTVGRIFALENDTGAIHFVGRRNWRDCHGRIALEDFEVAVHESGVFSEDIILENRKTRKRLVLRLSGASPEIAKRICEDLIQTRVAPSAQQQQLNPPTSVSQT